LGCIVEGRGQSINLSVLHQFIAGNNDGASPYSELTQGADGVLYGTTWSGGTNAAGIVFRINRDGGGFTILHHFGSAADGSTPFDGVIQAGDGFLYGTTYYGGTNSNGTIFKIDTNGSFYSVLYRFTNSPDGANSYGGLVQGLDGALYGTTYAGGSGPGTVFKINTDGGGYSVLHSFTNFTDATQPFSRLVQGSNGLLYGTTYSGGPNILGTVFQINTNGSNYGVLHGFGGVSEGFSLECGVTLGKDGWLYGTTISGGDASYGTVFKLNTNGSVYATLRSFTNSPDGANSYARLAQGNDGFLYGVTSSGGNTNTGTIFRLNTNGANYSVLHRFNGAGDGKVPMAGMFTTGNGVFYGMTLMGGATNGGFGTIYRLAMVPVLTIDFSTPTAPLLTLNGFANQSCQVEVSSDMVHWSVLTNLSLTNGTAQVYDSNNVPTRFYRALIP
jgi:uncharacterized repeat protein (TIGR03803 family)